MVLGEKVAIFNWNWGRNLENQYQVSEDRVNV